MPKKTFKYNSACEAAIHTNQSHVFVLHVARCKVCQEKLPGDILEALEPDLSKLRENIAKREAEAKKKEVKKSLPIQPVKVEQKVSPQPKPPTPEPKEPVSKSPPIKPTQPVDDLDKKIRDLPSIQGLAKTIGVMKADIGRVSASVKNEIKAQGEEFKALGERIELLLGMGGAVAKDAGKEDTIAEDSEDKDMPDTPVQTREVEPSIKIPTKKFVPDTPDQVPEVIPSSAEPATEGEHITIPQELLREAQDIKKDLGMDSQLPSEPERIEERISMREGEVKPVPSQKEEPVIPPVQEPGPVASPGIGGIADLDRPEQIEEAERAMKLYISQQKQKLGMGEGGGVGGEKSPVGKGIGFLGDAKDIATQVRGIIEAVKGGGGGGEGTSLPKTTEELASQVLMQVVKGAASKKDPIEYLTAGMKLSNDNLANSIKLFSGLTGKGNIGPSTEDIETVVAKVVQKMITPATTTERLPTGEEGKQ